MKSGRVLQSLPFFHFMQVGSEPQNPLFPHDEFFALTWNGCEYDQVGENPQQTILLCCGVLKSEDVFRTRSYAGKTPLFLI